MTKVTINIENCNSCGCSPCKCSGTAMPAINTSSGCGCSDTANNPCFECENECPDNMPIQCNFWNAPDQVFQYIGIEVKKGEKLDAILLKILTYLDEQATPGG